MSLPALILKFVYLSICITYSFIHILNLQLSSDSKHCLFKGYLFSSLLTAFFCPIINHYLPIYLSLVLVLIHVTLFMLVFRVPLFPTITATIISYGLSYCIRTLVTISVPFLIKGIPLFSNDSIALTYIFIISFCLTFLLFRIKRFSHGFPFIYEPKYSDTGTLLSVLIFLIVFVLNTFSFTTLQSAILLLAIIVLGIFTFFWIRKSFKRKYADILKKNEFTRLGQEQKKITEELEKLKAENERLSAIIHKDNKLMNALLLAGKECAYWAYEPDDEKRKRAADRILHQLEEASSDRAELIRNYEFNGRRLPETGNDRIDSLLSYMSQRAFAEKISFDILVDPEFMKAVSARISTEDLTTLLADLVENAIVATRTEEKRHILVSFQRPDDRPVFAVYDSGVPFPEKVKQAWGRERVTMHADTGGSGIGMMTTYEICNKIQADFRIEENPPVDLYTKCISVSF